MRIANNRFRDIDKGDVFRFEGNYFIRINEFQGVNLETGDISSFHVNMRVVSAPPDAVLRFSNGS